MTVEAGEVLVKFNCPGLEPHHPLSPTCTYLCLPKQKRGWKITAQIGEDQVLFLDPRTECFNPLLRIGEMICCPCKEKPTQLAKAE